MERRVNLPEIFGAIPAEGPVPELPSVPISGITLDSRTAKPGDLFVAMHGRSLNGHDFIPQAIANGAVAVVGEQEVIALSVPYIQMRDTRRALTHIAAAFYGWPGRHLTVIGVTGTDGKTTTTNLIYRILLAAGRRTGMISTVNAVIGDDVLDTGFHVTTPDAHDLQRFLAQMVKAGLTHAVLETTSHGWAQHRVDACEFDIGVITNITHEHLDEHGSYESYRAAKARLLLALAATHPKASGNPRLGVINRDDQSYEFLRALQGVRTMSYGLAADADVRALDVTGTGAGVEFIAQGRDFQTRVTSPLVGAYNVSNCLAALTAAVFGLEIDPTVAARGIASLEPLPGRMERIDLGQPFTAIVDFAHTPNALKVSLTAARAMLTPQSAARVAKQPRLIALFGSAGLRDREKRRMMAAIAAELADFSVLTAEDPRTESLDGILEEMAAGARSTGGREGETFWRVPDRGEAIRFAIGLAHPGDIVIACGKGHEQSMCFGLREHPWDDRTAMRAALAEHLGIAGPAMPYLPTHDTAESEWLLWK